MLEAAPGISTWVLLLSPAWIALVFASTGAFAVAVAVLIFDLYWFVRSFTLYTGMWSTYLRMRRDMGIDWVARCREPAPEGAPDPLSFHHLSIIPTYTEPYGVLERTVQAIVDASYPKEQKLIGIITRVEDKPGWANVAKLREKFGEQVGGFYHIKDPLEPPLVPGKSAAMNWGGRECRNICHCEVVAESTRTAVGTAQMLLWNSGTGCQITWSRPGWRAWCQLSQAKYSGWTL